MTTREQVIHELSKRYPYPWKVGWWFTDERCGVEVRCGAGRGITCAISGRGIRGARLASGCGRGREKAREDAQPADRCALVLVRLLLGRHDLERAFWAFVWFVAVAAACAGLQLAWALNGGVILSPDERAQ
jgi:hypothetical protein